ncbi:MAG: hypothetical protein EBS01_03325 [Verrucomicrobia bacterium]|nr:hypothetical protein [Verrucomicrobiota bacterium]
MLVRQVPEVFYPKIKRVPASAVRLKKNEGETMPQTLFRAETPRLKFLGKRFCLEGHVQSIPKPWLQRLALALRLPGRVNRAKTDLLTSSFGVIA